MPERVTIEVDLGHLENEWEVIAIRAVKQGEFYLQSWPEKTVAQSPCASTEPYVIVRRRWKWPAGLKCAAIAMDANRSWWAYSRLPRQEERAWRLEDDFVQLFSWQIDLPVVDDWRESLRLNPHREKAT